VRVCIRNHVGLLRAHPAFLVIVCALMEVFELCILRTQAQHDGYSKSPSMSIMTILILHSFGDGVSVNFTYSQVQRSHSSMSQSYCRCRNTRSQTRTWNSGQARIGSHAATVTHHHWHWHTCAPNKLAVECLRTILHSWTRHMRSQRNTLSRTTQTASSDCLTTRQSGSLHLHTTRVNAAPPCDTRSQNSIKDTTY
jgi:hypothetical protein